MTPPPRLVPDRPSDAVQTGPYVDRIVRIFRDRPYDDTTALVLIDFAQAAIAARDAAAPPAEAPGERGVELPGMWDRADLIGGETDSAPSVGMVLVPCDPTKAMLDAGASEADDTREIYRAMLAAAHAAPAPDCCDTPNYCSSVRRSTAKDQATLVTGGREDVETEWVVTSSRAGPNGNPRFTTEAEAFACFAEESQIPSYINPSLMRQAQVYRVRTETTDVTADAIAALQAATGGDGCNG